MEKYYEFWLGGEKVLTEDKLDVLLSTAARYINDGEWVAEDMHDFFVIECATIPVELSVSFKRKK